MLQQASASQPLSAARKTDLLFNDTLHACERNPESLQTPQHLRRWALNLTENLNPNEKLWYGVADECVDPLMRTSACQVMSTRECRPGGLSRKQLYRLHLAPQTWAFLFSQTRACASTDVSLYSARSCMSLSTCACIYIFTKVCMQACIHTHRCSLHVYRCRHSRMSVQIYTYVITSACMYPRKNAQVRTLNPRQACVWPHGFFDACKALTRLLPVQLLCLDKISHCHLRVSTILAVCYRFKYVCLTYALATVVLLLLSGLPCLVLCRNATLEDAKDFLRVVREAKRRPFFVGALKPLECTHEIS